MATPNGTYGGGDDVCDRTFALDAALRDVVVDVRQCGCQGEDTQPLANSPSSRPTSCGCFRCSP